MHLQLRKFDPTRMRDEAVCMLIGKRNTGKSVLVKDIMYHKRHFSFGIVFSPTESVQGFFKPWVPDTFIYNKFDAKVLEKLMDAQERRIQDNTVTPVFCIIDDCMYDKSFLNTEVIRRLFMNGRHYRIFALITAQYCGDINPASRSNIDYCFALRDNTINIRKRLYENFFGLLPKFDQFCALMDATTENYECLVLDNTCQSNKIDDALAWYKARIDRSFVMGNASLWRFHKTSYDPGTPQAPPPRHSLVIKKLPGKKRRT